MGRNKKRKHEESDAITVIDHSRKEHKKPKKDKSEKHSKRPKRPKRELVPDTPNPSAPANASEISKNFDSFTRALSTLLATSSDTSKIRLILGDDKANFLVALQTMKTAGDLHWLDTPTTTDESAESDEVEDEPPTTSGAAIPQPTPPTTLPKAPLLSLGRPASLPTSTTNWPPPLPEIKNESLRLQAFTHKSFIKGEESSLPGTENRHYERLEFLGDSYLQSIASHLLFNRFPTLREGALSDIRQQLVANRPLSTYATMYKFHHRIREGKGQENTTPVTLTSTPPGLPKRSFPRDASITKANTTEINKTLADCFEAYIAAIILDDPEHGMETVTSWLAALYGPKLKEMEIQYDSIEPIDKMAKQTLNKIAGGNRVVIEYRWDGGGGGNKGGYWINVLLTGWGFKERHIGRGWGPNKNDAALRAAMNVIADKEFCEEMARVRLAILGPKPTNNSTSSSSTSSPRPPPLGPPPPGPPQLKNTGRPIAQNGDVLNYDD